MLRAEVQLAWKTRAGHHHRLEGRENEDAVFVTHVHPVFDAVLIVADGMGGHPQPREASEAAVRAAREMLWDASEVARGPNAGATLTRALAAAHQAVRTLGGGGSRRRPGTTLTLAVVAEGMVYVMNVGDGSVYLMREGQVRTIAGGEQRRSGNRPAQYLGQDDQLEVEARQFRVAAGDRLLLCTDGLTRYFNDVGPEALERVLGRPGVEMQTVASQLTAHSRADEYDDDTTVALAEVSSLEAVSPPRAAERPAVPGERAPESGLPASRPRGETRPAAGAGVRTAALVVVGALLGAGLLGSGFLLGRGLERADPASSPPVATHPTPPPVAPTPAPAPAWLPPGNLILLDPLSKRVYALGAGSGLPREAAEFQALKVGSDGRLSPVPGRFQLDPARGQLKDPAGKFHPVAPSSDGAGLRLLVAGTLRVETAKPGARVTIDGTARGVTPLQVTVAAGRHRLAIRAGEKKHEAEIDVPTDRPLTVRAPLK